MAEQGSKDLVVKKAFSFETVIFLALLSLILGSLSHKMGAINMVNTMLNTAYGLLMDTVFYIMAIAVIAGALSSLFTEFGVVAVINRILSPLMKPLYGLPGAAIVGVITTYLSDNPAILSLADDSNFRRYFKKYQLPAINNLGTSFGMGLIVTAFVMGIKNDTGENFVLAALIGNIGAIIGSVVSVRLMLLKTKKIFGTEESVETIDSDSNSPMTLNERIVRNGNPAERCLDSILEGGKSGVKVGMSIIPGVLIICTLVMMFTNGASASGVYTGAAYEGIGLLPKLAEKIEFILVPLFGFSSSEAIAVPITALGSAGASIGLIPELVKNHLAYGNDVAVFTAMCMCWSGYLSTHVAMMDSLNYRELTGYAILSHTIGGICAGASAHYLYMFLL